MENRYRIILTGKNLYKEAELLPDMKNIRLGTATECEIRLRRELFFGQIELTFVQNDGSWSVLCSDNLYLNVGDARKLFTLRLSHGSTFNVNYQDSNTELFTVEFLIDFENERKKFTRSIDIRGVSSFGIGAGQENQIILVSRYVKNDSLLLSQANNTLTLNIRNTTYGVYINGRRAQNGEKIQNGDFFSISDAIFYYKDGLLWTENSDVIRINRLNYSDEERQQAYPMFKRNSRVKVVPSEEKIEILDPPAKPEKPKANILQRLLPSMGMLIASGVMAFIGSPTMLIFSGISGVMAIVTAVIGMKEGKKEFEQKTRDRFEKYNAYISNKRIEIEQARQEERTVLEEIYVSDEVARQNLTNFAYNLFDRSADDEDFLCVRLGTGNVAAKREINYKKQEKLEIEDDLQLMPAQLSDEYRTVQGAPVVCDLKAVNAVGVTGTIGCQLAMLKCMVLDIVARQYHSDAQLVFVADEVNKDHVWRYRMLPHVYNEALHTRNIVCNAESKNLIFEYLYKELSQREQSKSHDSNIVVFLLNESGFNSHPISKFVDKAKDLGVTFVFFGQERADIAQGCGALIEVLDMRQGVLVDTSDKNHSTKFIYNPIDDETMDSIVSLLTPVYTEEISLEGTLTKNISMFQLLNILAVDDLDLEKRWASTKVHKSMSAPIGVSKTGVVSLDLHDKFHGPHGLVAGTTGSGKSEILQTYILSMATLFHPYEVGFVIIDFKGGGMVNQFRELPHLMGAITNIDGREINRSLKSIKAELQKRQRLFAEADVNHIDKYIQKFKVGEVREPLPHLIIIVDEFAELKAEQPEFMKELISAARIGRSLGVHLILATQKPAGQVNEQIWSNSRFKLCLKVQTQEDSNEVLKSPLAAEIKEPGRAYLQVGNNEIFELFQSAYSGASERADDSNVKEFAIYELPDTGKRVPVFAQRRQKSGENNSTQLDAIVRYVHDYCDKTHISKLSDICLPALSEIISFPEKISKRNGESIWADVGIYDDPDNQYQGTYAIDLTNQNVMLIGSAQSGKTNVLQTIIRSVATNYTPEEVNIYIIDFASMVLKNFEGLNHVGGVVTASEDEKLKNLFKLLRSEMEARKEKMLSVGVSSFAAYKEAGKTDIPQIILMIDNLTALKELYFQDDDELLSLCREGLSVGISVVIANAQTAGIGYKYLSNFSCRIAMFCNDSGEYGSLFDHCRERIEDIHGRSIVEIDKIHLECQMYLAFEGEKEIQRVAEIRTFISRVNENNRGACARVIPLIPAVLTSEYIQTNFAAYMQEPYTVITGLDYATVSPAVLQLNGVGAIGISGKPGAGKQNFICYIIQMLGTMYPGNTEVTIIDGLNKRLAGMKSVANVVSYDFLADRAIDAVNRLEQRLAERYNALATEVGCEDNHLLLLVLNSRDAVEAISSNTTAMNAYRNITGKYKNMNVCVLVGDFENANVPYAAPEIFKKLKETKQIFFFDDLANIKILDMPLAMLRQFKKQVEVGEGYFIRDNECCKIKTPIAYH